MAVPGAETAAALGVTLRGEETVLLARGWRGHRSKADALLARVSMIFLLHGSYSLFSHPVHYLVLQKSPL